MPNPHEDAFGLVGGMPADRGVRRILPEGFDPGPAVGERLPDFELGDHTGRRVRFHAERDGAKAAVVFFRSAVW